MRASLSRRLVAVTSTALLSLGTVAAVTLDASAATTNPITATTIGVSDVLSGTPSFHLTVRVANPLPPTSSSVADYVRITVPAQLTVLSGSGNGWSSRLRDARSVEFDAPSVPSGSAPIAPGQKADFDIEVAADTVAQDTIGALEVSTSTDGGVIISDATPAKTNALRTRIYILRLTNPTLTFPTTTHKLTAGQSGIPLQFAAENHGSQPVTVSVAATGTSGDTAGSAADAIIAPGTSQSYTLPVTAGTAGTARSLRVSATSPAGSTAKSTAPYDVQSALDFAYDGTHPMAPTYGRSGGWAGFALTVLKSGAQAITLSPQTSLYFVNTADSTKTFTVPLGYSTTIAAGTTSQRIGFHAITVPGSPTLADWDGDYTPTLTIDGIDSNGAPVHVVTPVTTLFTIDNTGPVATPTLSTPHRVGRVGGSVNDASMPYVAKNGDVLTFGGQIFKNGSSTTLDSTAKVSCIVDSLRDGHRIGEQSFKCSNSNGTISGMAAPTFASGADAAQLRVTTVDAGGNTATSLSNTIVVDNIVPQLDFARTGLGGSTPSDRDAKTVRVKLREPVIGGFNAADFTVHNGPVTFPVSAVFFDGTGTTFGQTLVLTLADPIGRNDTPIVDYHVPSAPAAQDAAGNLMLSSSLTSHDGIVPTLPMITQIDGKSISDDGQYYDNNASPTYSLSNLTSDETTTLYADTDGTPGLQTASDLTLCSVRATGSTATCSSTSTALPADGTYSIMAQTVDPSGNVSTGANGEHWSAVTFVLDRVAPGIAGFVASGSGVTADFTEPVVTGRDAARDWSVYNSALAYVVGTVTASSTTTRDLSINSLTWMGTATRVRYVFTGSTPTDRYADRAGNVMPDQYYDVTTGTTILS